MPDADSAETDEPQPSTGISTDTEETRFDRGPEQGTEIGDGQPSVLDTPSEPAPAQPPAKQTIVARLKPKFHRPAKPVKSESTLEAFENKRRQDETEQPAAGAMHYVVWEVELPPWDPSGPGIKGARIYKVPEGRLATIRQQPHADRLKFFDNLEKAKVEALALRERITNERKAQGRPFEPVNPPEPDFMTLTEITVPTSHPT